VHKGLGTDENDRRIVSGCGAVLHGAVHVVVVGCGRVGSGLAVGLVDRGHSVSIVDKLAKAFRRLPDGWPGTTIVGSGFDRGDLERAGAQRAGALAAVTSGDNSNILTARIARETYGIANVVARIYDPRRAEIYQRLGIPTVATVRWTIDQVMHRLVPESAVEWTDDTGHLAMVDRLLPERWAGKRLRDVGLPGRATLVAVTRSGVPRLDVADLVGQEGDVLHLAVLIDALDELEEQVAGTDAVRPRTGTDPQ
jgi:trk system potassium uptake protein TrkA